MYYLYIQRTKSGIVILFKVGFVKRSKKPCFFPIKDDDKESAYVSP